MLVIALAVLLLAAAGFVFIVAGLALIAGSLVLQPLLLAGGVTAGFGVALLLVAIVIIAVSPPVRAFLEALTALLRIAPDLGPVMRRLAAALLLASQKVEAFAAFLNDDVKPLVTTAKSTLDALALKVPAGGVKVPHFDLQDRPLSKYLHVTVPSGLPDPEVFSNVDRTPRQILDVHQDLQAAADAMSGLTGEIDLRSADAHQTSVALSEVSAAITTVFGSNP